MWQNETEFVNFLLFVSSLIPAFYNVLFFFNLFGSSFSSFLGSNVGP